MQNLGVNVYIEGNLQNEKVISYTREVDICSGLGTLLLTLDDTISPSIQVGDTVIVYEEGTKVGTFYMGSPAHDIKGSIQIQCQDESKYLQAFFIHKMYNTGGGTSRYWIGKILDWAGISYNFTTASNGYVLPPNDKVGLEYGYNVVLQLCQQSGWYFFFDGEGVCQIGELSTSWSNPQFTLATSGGTVLKEGINSDDNMLRNRVVVWGGAVEDFQNPYKVFVSLSVTTPWDRDANDKRTIVYTNNYIRDRGTAYYLAKKLLDEYSQTISVKTYDVVGAFNETLGTIGYFDTYVFNGTGMVTSLAANVSSDGFVTTIFVDERCPRQFGYWALGSEYVYVGTDGNGVWRKPLDGATWSNWSTGLTNLYVQDLKIKNGLFACTTNDYRVYYRKIIDSAWTAFSPTGFFDELGDEYQLVDLLSKGCGINENTGEIIYGFYEKINKKSWIVRRFSGGTYTVKLVNTLAANEFQLHDVDTNNVINIVSASKIRTVDFDPPPMVRSSGAWFGRGNHAHNAWGDYEYSLDHITQTPVEISTSNADYDSPLTCWDGTYLYFAALNGWVYQWDVENNTFSSLQGALTDEYYALTVVEEGIVIATSQINGTTIRTWRLNFNTSSSTLIQTISNGNGLDFWWSGIGFVDSSGDAYAVWIAVHNGVGGTIDNIKVYWYNHTTLSITAETISPSFNANTNLTDIYSYGGIPKIGDEYACSVATFNCQQITGGVPFAETGIFLHFDLENKSTSHVLLEDVGLTPDEFYSYYSVYDPFSEKFYFVLDGYLGTTRGEDYWVITKTGTDEGVTNLSSYLDATEELFYGFGGKEKGYFLTENGSYKIREASSMTTIKSGLDTYRFALTPNDRSAQFEAYYISTTGALKSTQGDQIASTSINGTNQLYPALFGKYFVCFDRTANIMYVIKKASGDDSETTSHQALVELPTPIVSVSGYDINFQFRNTFTYPLNIEISRESPIVFFGGSVASGTPVGGVGELWVTAYATSGDWHKSPNTLGTGVTLHGYYPDARVGDVLGLSSTVDGWVYHDPPSGFARYVYSPKPYQSISYKSGLYYREAYQFFDAWNYFEGFPGTLHKCELSNYRFASPYTFVSSSGYPSRFWQLDPGVASNFVEYSTGLPNGNVTVIRLDDRI